MRERPSSSRLAVSRSITRRCRGPRPRLDTRLSFFYIQQLGKHAWNLVKAAPITKQYVETAIQAVQRALDRVSTRCLFSVPHERSVATCEGWPSSAKGPIALDGRGEAGA
jgi:hypothetical protein